MSAEITLLVAKLLAFAVAILPLLIDNLRTFRATNLNNLILGAGGLAMLGAEHLLGWSDQPLWSISAWLILGVIGLVALHVFSGVPGGVAKTLMALLPWFPSTDFFLVLGAGFIFAGLIGAATRREVPTVPAFAIASSGIWLYNLITPTTL